MGLFSSSIHADGDTVLVKFFGTLDENCNFNGSPLTAYNHITLDLKGIDRVTSKGIRAWLIWLTHLDQSKDYSVIDASRVFITQANLVPDMLPAWMSVKSLELPYFCDACGHSFGVVQQLAGNGPGNVAMTHSCPRCGEKAEFDALPEKYFHFLKHFESGK